MLRVTDVEYAEALDIVAWADDAPHHWREMLAMNGCFRAANAAPKRNADNRAIGIGAQLLAAPTTLTTMRVRLRRLIS